MIKELIIVGAGNTARDILQFVKDVNLVEPKWHIKGFIGDWGQDIETLTNGEFSIIGTIEQWQPGENEVFVCAIGVPQVREKVVKQLKHRGAKFIQLIHPTVTLNDYCKIGEGVVIYPNTFLGANAILRDYVVVHPNVIIGHDASIEDFTTISSSCAILGGVQLGKHVFVGAHVTVVPFKKIDDDAYIGAGSVVIRNVAEGTKVFGNPAKRLDF